MARIHLHPDMFAPDERRLAEQGGFGVSTFRFRSGVAGVRIFDAEREVVLLPFQGQQVWSARLGGRDLAMRSMFDEPEQTQDFLRNYGGFLIHCGVTAMGSPGADDTHPPHGELPNAPYRDAWLDMGIDGDRATLSLSGAYRHTVGFATNYVATPTVRLVEGEDRLFVSLAVENLKRTPMELMYLAHINFRPVNGSTLHQSALSGPKHQRVRYNLPAHVRTSPGYRDLLDVLATAPERHHTIDSSLVCDPEVVLSIDCLADDAGWAMSLQLLPDGTADFVRHRPSQLAHGVRWISRTPDQDCLGLLLPATAETEGLTAERRKGNVISLGGGETFRCQYEAGVLDRDTAGRAIAAIGRVLASERAVAAGVS